MGSDLESAMDDILDDFDAKVEEPILRDADFGEKAGDVLGPYTLEECLGEGGFGSVWRASQERPLRREVALKILKMGMDTKEVLARFEQERQVLALMDHPAICRVLDAGATPSGRPYFAMELVRDGRSLTRYCSENDLPAEETLALFAVVCDAVRHAHRKGVIHRDLKPGNLLVTTENGSPEPKVIDFGIAKATGDDKLTDHTLVTRDDRLMGTPAYMSPEQLGGGRDVDTRTDVYSLGVILYELLTGTTPFADRKTADAEPAEWARLVRERSPRKPSTIAGKTGGPTRREIQSQLSGDLDIVVMKALEPERERRYESMGAFVDDIRRYLRREPILARPRSNWYTAKRFAQRNKAGVIGATGILVALVAGLIVSSFLFLQERESRRLADLEAERSRQVIGILKRTFESAGNSKARGRDTTILQDILAETAEDITNELEGKPDIEAEIRQIIGRTYFDLDEYGKSIEQWERLLALRRELGDPTAIAEALLELGEAKQRGEKQSSGEDFAEEAITVLEEAGLSHTSLWYWGRGLLAWSLSKSGRVDEALPLAEEAFHAWREDPGNPHLKDIPDSYALCLRRTGRLEESVAVLRENVETLMRTNGGPNALVILNKANIGSTLLQMGKLAEAKSALHEGLEMGREVFHDRNPHEDYLLTSLSRLAGKEGDREEERRLMEEAVSVSRRIYQPGNQYRREATNAMVNLLFRHAETRLDSGDLSGAKGAIARIETLADEHPIDCDVDPERLAKLKGAVADANLDQ